MPLLISLDRMRGSKLANLRFQIIYGGGLMFVIKLHKLTYECIRKSQNPRIRSDDQCLAAKEGFQKGLRDLSWDFLFRRKRGMGGQGLESKSFLHEY